MVDLTQIWSYLVCGRRRIHYEVFVISQGCFDTQKQRNTEVTKKTRVRFARLIGRAGNLAVCNSKPRCGYTKTTIHQGDFIFSKYAPDGKLVDNMQDGLSCQWRRIL